jgi:hypothetical protein
MKSIIWMAVLLCCFDDASAETRLVVNLASFHVHTPDFDLEDEGITEYNQSNYGVGFEYHAEDSGLYYGAGFYENSFFETSRYITIGVKASSTSNMYVSAELSAADGYRLSSKAHGDYLVDGGLALNTKFGDDGQHATKMLFMVGGIFGLQYSYRFGE